MENNNASVIYPLTYPRTASNLLVRTLALDQQRKVISPWGGGYFSRPVVVNNTLPYSGKHVQSWTLAERTRAAEVYQSCFTSLCEWIEKKHGLKTRLYSPKSISDSWWIQPR